MTVIQLQEQLVDDTMLQQEDVSTIIPFLDDGSCCEYTLKRGREEKQLCLRLNRKGENIYATGSYFVGLDWIKEKELAIQVSPKINNTTEIDYVKMLNDSLCEKENFEYLKDLVTIDFEKTSIPTTHQKDLLSIFLIIEFLNILKDIVRKGLKKSFYMVEENLHNKVRGRILISQNVNKNLLRGHQSNNICKYQVYGVDSNENRILKQALKFCIKQTNIYKHAIDISNLKEIISYVSPYFEEVSDNISTTTIKTFKGNPIYREYNQAIYFAQLILRRYSYDITLIGKEDIATPPFWIDMSKLFELYVFSHLRKVFNHKNELTYHKKAFYQELDYLLNPAEWPEPYVIDAKYKPRYKGDGISIDDARQISGYARLNSIYNILKLDPEKALPIKCLVVYPDQSKKEYFDFDRHIEPEFEKVNGYIRFYKVGIKLPEICY